ncbi:MAG: hydantoinase/oxoprolinase family protein [Acidobacteria bacterium]|nr:hydantoinase/oxoprolinase family protein [Acidobacteriota bacterium]
MKESFKIGIDVGGTFTDFFIWSDDGNTRALKVPSTPHDPSEAVMEGLAVAAQMEGLALQDFLSKTASVVHGTTVTTNAVLTRRGARTALVTTEGVRDALEMRRGIREERYNNRLQNVPPLVPRHLRRAVAGRVDAQGKEILPLDLSEVRELANYFQSQDIQAVAVCFMNSFANPQQEHLAESLLRETLPRVYLCTSSNVLPTIRFYNRVSTTVLNAYTGPVLRDYLQNLTCKLERFGFSGILLIVQSSGGMALPSAVLEKPAATLLSGPAAAPGAAVAFCRPYGGSNCIVVDMGGTSFDASLVRDGRVELKNEGDIERLRIALPMLDIVTIGAGGGSIGWIDGGGLLRMGPESAGSQPGPACYGCGGLQPTCTDANLTLGLLDPAFFAGGKLPLFPDLAAKAIEQHIAIPLEMSVEEAAAGMIEVINNNMTFGVREITVKRGLDPREFPMVVAGGAAGLHCCSIARHLEIRAVIVPGHASVLCALGMLLADYQHDFVKSVMAPLRSFPAFYLLAAIDDLAQQGESLLQRERVPSHAVQHEVSFELRYSKQYHEVSVPIPWEILKTDDRDEMARLFHREHDRLYGYELSDSLTGIDLINIRVRSKGLTAKPDLPRCPWGGRDPGAAYKRHRSVFSPARRCWEPIPVFDGHRLAAGNQIGGPALVERADTTVFIEHGWQGRIDEWGALLLENIES